MMNMSLGVGVIVALAWAALVIVGVTKRWTWVHWVVMILGLIAVFGALEGLFFHPPPQPSWPCPPGLQLRPCGSR
jgi:hypothetical protein